MNTDRKRDRPLLARIPVWSLCAAFLFGLSTPFSKPLTALVPPVWLATLFYGGSLFGILPGLIPRMGLLPESRKEFWLAGETTPKEKSALFASIVLGGVLAPLALIKGLTNYPASRGSLLMNAESLFTVLIATLLFGEKINRWMLAGVVLVSTGCGVLSFTETKNSYQGSEFFFLAAFLWALDTNILRALSRLNPLVVTLWKGAGSTLLLFPLAMRSGPFSGSPETILESLLVGAIGYGFSLVVFLRSLRTIGVVRTGAWFGFSPFIGAALSVIFLGEPVSITFVLSAGLLFLAIYILHKGEQQREKRTLIPSENPSVDSF
jgi:drug/metabolite transporter (DMT)-like permease